MSTHTVNTERWSHRPVYYRSLFIHNNNVICDDATYTYVCVSIANVYVSRVVICILLRPYAARNIAENEG